MTNSGRITPTPDHTWMLSRREATCSSIRTRDGYPDGIVQQTFALSPVDFAYYFFQGTSMAAPHVSGLAALLISHGVTGPDNVRKAIQQTAVDLGPVGWDEQYGWGRIDARTALGYFSATSVK